MYYSCIYKIKNYICIYKNDNYMKILGFTDEITSCDLCGKFELKGTYVMEDENGGIFHYGTTCGANAVGTSTKEFKKEAKKVENSKNIDAEMKIAKGDTAKLKLYKQAIKKGYNKDDFFIKYGEILDTTPWEVFYQLAHLVHRIKK